MFTLSLDLSCVRQVFPEHKFLIVETLRQRGFSVGMTGDGVNDAPALKKADVGIAVEGATDAARAAADLVLTAPGLSVIVDAIVISRCIFQRMKNYVIYRVASLLCLPSILRRYVVRDACACMGAFIHIPFRPRCLPVQ